MIYITRPAPIGASDAEFLTQRGLPAKHVPLFAINDVIDPRGLRAQLATFHAKTAVIITSPQIPILLQKHQIELPRVAHYFTIGKATQARLRKTQPTLTHLNSPKQEDSEGLMALFEAQNALQITSFVLLKGKQGRDHLETALRARDLAVQSLICYERDLIPDPLKAAQPIAMPAIWVAASGDHVQRLSECVSVARKANDFLIVLHQKQKKDALNLGWKKVYLAAQQQHESAIEAVRRQLISIGAPFVSLNPKVLAGI